MSSASRRGRFGYNSHVGHNSFKPYALVFEPQLQTRVWGGRHLDAYGKHLPTAQPYGESWELSDVEGESSLVARGDYRGKSLRELARDYGPGLIGPAALSGLEAGGFPLLIKLLDAQQNLSVQVHPSDEDLQRSKDPAGDLGKTEAWVILDAKPGAQVIHGLGPGVDIGAVVDRVKALAGGALPDGEAEKLFRWVNVKAGDVVFVPAGTVHALCDGVVLLEVQQTSDITYRIYDWGRLGLDGKPRDLHLEQSLTVSDSEPVPCPLVNLSEHKEPGVAPLIECDKFRLELVTLAPGEPLQASTGGTAGGFHILAGLDAHVEYATSSGDTLVLKRGEFTLLPAALGEYTLAGRGGATARCLRAS